VAVIELALLVSCSEDTRELLGSVRRTLGIVLEAAKSRAAERELLERTMRQAERLTVQEEELRLNNQELEAQREQLQRANDELEAQRAALSEQNRELESAREHLQQQANELGTVSTYKSQFLSNMSHELRTPLNSMLLLSHLLADNEAGNLLPKQVEHCRTIHAAGRDLLALINQVLDLSKIEAGKQEIDLEEADLSGFAEYARRNFGPMAADKGLDLVIEIAPNLPRAITTDRQRTERILTNLLGNALKFTERGEVRLSISRPDSRTTLQRPDLRPETTIAFAVSDTGIGIPVEAQERAFAPFEQLDAKPDRRYAGTGLGLTIARESATLLGGELQLRSAPGHGSTFTCYLPEKLGSLRPGVPPPKTNGTTLVKPATNGESKEESTPPGDETHVLVIEDDPILAEQLAEIIRARQLKVLVASTGEYGLRLAVEHRPRGILLDVKLPDIDGWTVIERLRRHPSTRSIPVHFISGVDAPERGLALGAVGYLLKPASHAELSRAVRAVTRSSSNSQRILVVEDDKLEGESLLALLRNQDVPASHVSTAAAALSALESETFGCVILDLGLPDLDGLSLLETLRARVGAGAPRVIVHTARSLTKQESRRLEAYAEAIVLKDGSSRERLLDEILLFVRHVRDSLPTGRTLPVNTPARPDVSLDGARILLAEDDMRTVYALSALLKGKGAEVLVADTGREALDVLAAHPEIQCLLLDLMMPEMDGYEAMRLLRKDARFVNLPVIVLTAKAMKGERER
ncbi:MAG TPA: response regulator, partial [Polyangiaceae bacterium]|nr:response regulator [Polyangiaceae bacterium]